MILTFQGPFPPFPPSGPPEEVIAVISIAVITAGFFLLRPLVRSWARRIEGRAGFEAVTAELDQVRDRLQEVDELHNRVAELEERVDFSDRLLAQQSQRVLHEGKTDVGER